MGWSGTGCKTIAELKSEIKCDFLEGICRKTKEIVRSTPKCKYLESNERN